MTLKRIQIMALSGLQITIMSFLLGSQSFRNSSKSIVDEVFLHSFSFRRVGKDVNIFLLKETLGKYSRRYAKFFIW